MISLKSPLPDKQLVIGCHASEHAEYYSDIEGGKNSGHKEIFLDNYLLEAYHSKPEVGNNVFNAADF